MTPTHCEKEMRMVYRKTTKIDKNVYDNQALYQCDVCKHIEVE